MGEKGEPKEITPESIEERKSGVSKKERQVLSRNAKPKPHTKKEMKERRMKKRLKEEEQQR
jgi:hypothetical protein